ncbi:MAG: hypothetical protein SOH95_06625 [Bifidobacterium crudilactis]|jgi:hypothetical protein
MSDLTEVGKGFAGWAEENSGLAVDENFEYTDRTVGNFACAAFAAGARWQAQREPTEAEIEAAAFGIYRVIANNGFPTPDNALHQIWDATPDNQRDMYRGYAKAALEAALKAVTE